MRVSLIPVVLLLTAHQLFAADGSIDTWFDPAGISGKLVICGGGELPERIVEYFVAAAGGDSGRLVVIPTASSQSGTADAEEFTSHWQGLGLRWVTVLHASSREEANAPEVAATLRDATAVWFVGGQQSRIAEAYVGTTVEQGLADLLGRGGVIGGTSAGAAIQSQIMIAGGNPTPVVTRGFNLLPGCVIDQHFTERNRKARLVQAIADHPGCVGCGVDERTALIVEGRRLTVLGEGGVTVCLPNSSRNQPAEIVLREDDVADLTALRRIAQARSAGDYPPNIFGRPRVEHGSLLLGGGGGLPSEVVAKFIELAGGPESRIVVLPTALETVPNRVSEVKMFQREGAKDVVVLPQRTRDQVESDDFRRTLESARGVWFCGGRQWRFVDSYENSSAIDLFLGVLRRGGVIGGSSAGASIQAEYLVRGNPLGNQQIMSEGYERGFGFLPGVAIDQHFSQRRRFHDMSRLVETFPRLLGIGIDEGTALVVRGEMATVVGKGAVHFFDRGAAANGSRDEWVSRSSGQTYDLVSRMTIRKGG